MRSHSLLGALGILALVAGCDSTSEGHGFKVTAGLYSADSIVRQDNDVTLDAQQYGATFTLTLTSDSNVAGDLDLPAEFGPLEADDSPYHVTFNGTWKTSDDSLRLYSQPTTFIGAKGWSVHQDTLRVSILTDPGTPGCFCDRHFHFRLVKVATP